MAGSSDYGGDIGSEWLPSADAPYPQVGPSATISTRRERTPRRMIRKKRFVRDVQHETGSENEEHWSGEYAGAMYREEGHGVPVATVAAPFYQVNPARWNGADREPIPITPVRGQNWPEMQVQLKNGWGQTSFGHKLSYDDYLRLLTDSATKNRHYLIPSPSGLGPKALGPGPAPSNVNQLIQNTAGKQAPNPGGPGMLAGNANLSGRTSFN